MAGNDLRAMPPEIRDILTNREVIAVDQDRLGRQGRKVRDDGDLEVWAKELADGSRAVALLNRGAAPARLAVSWPEIGYTATLAATVRDLWVTGHTARATGRYEAEVAAHGVVMVRITP
jgi:alpha-galactosidase